MDDHGIDDRTEGSLKKAGGTIEKNAGEAVESPEMEREGAQKETEGSLQKAWGDVKDAADEVTDDD